MSCGAASGNHIPRAIRSWFTFSADGGHAVGAGRSWRRASRPTQKLVFRRWGPSLCALAAGSEAQPPPHGDGGPSSSQGPATRGPGPPGTPSPCTPAPGGCSLLATPRHRSLMTRAAVFPHDVDLRLCPSGPSRAPESKCGLGSGALLPTACVDGTDRTGVGSAMFWYPQTPLR